MTMLSQDRTNEIRAEPPSMSLRTGAEYIRSLNDGRAVFVEGERVKDVSRHKAFREAARSVARLYDIAAAPENRELMTFTSPKTGAPVHRSYQMPGSHADLRQRRLFHEKWAEATFGLMGRTPDHVAGFFTGYAAVPEVFAKGGQKYARQCRGVLREDARRSISMSATRSCRHRSTAANRRTSRAIRRFMPAWSRSATTAS